LGYLDEPVGQYPTLTTNLRTKPPTPKTPTTTKNHPTKTERGSLALLGQ
jgi:hypothetical protein